jgi:hypothetical protein
MKEENTLNFVPARLQCLNEAESVFSSIAGIWGAMNG